MQINKGIEIAKTHTQKFHKYVNIGGISVNNIVMKIKNHQKLYDVKSSDIEASTLHCQTI